MIEEGRWMGCSDSGPPVEYSEYALSRAVDVIHAIRSMVRHIVDQDCTPEQAVHDIELDMIKACVPQMMRLEMTWSHWQYRQKR